MIKGLTERDLTTMAMELEEEGIRLYERCLALFPAMRGGALETALRQEREHYRSFADLDAALARKGFPVAPDHERRAVLDALAAELTLPANLMQVAASSETPRLSALLGRMIHAEALSIAFYKSFGENAPPAKVAAMILREETDHKRFLEGLRAEAMERERLTSLARNRYNYWLSLCKNDPADMAELRALAGDDEALFDAFWTEMEFATAGMRGVIGLGSNRMNKYNIRRATQGLARLLLEQERGAERGVVIAYDSRRFSREFALETALVLCNSGVRAMLFPSLRPVPVLSFAVRYLNAGAGVVITASHNPKEYNGYKVYGPDGGQMPPEATERLVSFINQGTLGESRPMDEGEARAAGLLTDVSPEVDDAYTARVKGLCISPDLCAEMGGRLSILYTPLNGSGNLPVRRVLDELGFTNVHLVQEQTEPDPEFTTVGVPNPESPVAFALAMRQAGTLEPPVDVILGTDPDCDRLGAAVRNAEGTFVMLTGNQIGCLLLHYILSSLKERGALPANGAVVKSIVSTQLAAAIAEDFGVAMFDVLTGFKFIAEKIQEFEDTGSHSFLFGFEESYGFLAGDFVRDKDAVIAAMLLAETCAAYKKRGMTLYEGLQRLYKTYGYYGERTLSVTLAGKEGQDRIAEIMARLRRVPMAEIASLRVLATRDMLSGLRTTTEGAIETLDIPLSDVLYYELEDRSWVCVRPSGTEPKIKLYLNAVTDSDDATVKALDALEAAMKEKLGV